MRYLITIISLLFIVNCNLPTVFNAPPDFHYNPPNPIEIDTFGGIGDSIILPPDTCTGYIEYTEPQFVCLYVKFDNPQDSVLWQGGGISSYDLAEVVQHVTILPFKIDTNPIGASVLIKGTNNHTQFQTKIFARVDGGKWYLGSGKQNLILPGIEAAKFKADINDYPSFDVISFYGTDYDSLTYVNLCREILKDCHGGRSYADLYFIPYQLDQTLIDSFNLAGWDRVRIH